MCGDPLDVDNNGICDLDDMEEDGFLVKYDGSSERYVSNDDPYSIDTALDKEDFIKNLLPMYTENLSYILYEWSKTGNNVSRNAAMDLEFLFSGDVIDVIEEGTKKEIGCDFSITGQDYEYNDNNEVVAEASEFHRLRRKTIIDLITSVMREEFNEHNDYAKNIGVTYNFNIPDIDRDQWNNTIDDISVLAFIQGMPMGGDSYYNNYSLGGSRIVRANLLYGETVLDSNGKEHNVYHKHYCPLIPRDLNGKIIQSYDLETLGLDPDGNGYFDYKAPNGMIRKTSGIKDELINYYDAHVRAEYDDRPVYFICSECM